MKSMRSAVYAVIAATGFSSLTGCASPPRPVDSGGRDVPGRSEPIAQRRMTSGVELPSTLDGYLAEAYRNNPRLRAAFEDWQAARERIPQARALADPTVSFEYFLDQVDGRYQVSLTQMLPAPGVRRLRGERAAVEARAAAYRFDAARFDLYERVVRGFYEYHYLARATAVTEENVRLLTELERAIKARYEAGEVAFADLIKVQVERERLTDRLAAMSEQRCTRSADLAALLHRPADTVLPWPHPEPPAEVEVDEESLAGMLYALNPELKAAAAQAEAAGVSRELARRDGWPGFMVGAGYMVMSGMDGRGDESDVGLMAGVTLPVWRGRVRAARREAAAARRAAEHGRDDRVTRVRAELSMAVFQFRDAERRVRLYAESLLPKAEQALDVARQAYADGQAGFMTLIDAQRMLLEFQLMAERAAVDREIAIADIRCCVGHDALEWTDPADPADRKPEAIP